MPSPKAGDRLRATLGDNVLVGTVTGVDDTGYAVQLDSGDTVAVDLRWAVEAIPAPPAPATPPGTVVLDNVGVAWQAGAGGVMTPALPATVLPQYPDLDALLEARGPLTLLEIAHA